MSSHQQQFRRGTVAQQATFTGAEAEVTAIIDASGTTRQLVIHDGQTQGGFEVLNARDVQELRGIYDPAATVTDLTAPDQRIDVTVSPKPKGLAAGLHVRFRMPSTNTGGTELRINGDANLSKALRKEGGVTVMEPGDLLQNYVYLAVFDETLDRFILVGGGGGGGGGVTQQLWTAPGSYTWTKPAGCQKVRVRVWAGGGGGGGSGPQGTGGGGGGGGYSEKLIDVTSIVTESVVVGTGGGPGTGFNPGGPGGASSFGSHCSATAGGGGQGQGVRRGGDPGSGSGGDLNGRPSRGFDSAAGGGGALGIGSGGYPSAWGAHGAVLVEEYYS